MLDQQAKAIEEIACYGLPYGGIGFASHILTYYTIITHLCGRQPLTWKPLKYGKFNLLLGVTQLIATVVITSITIHRCQEEWFFVILGVWMLTTSISLAFLSMSMTFLYRPRRRTQIPSEAAEAFELNWQPPSAITPNITAPPEDETIQPGFGTAIKSSTGAKCLIALITLLWFSGCAAGVVAIQYVTGPRYNYETQNAGTGPMYIVTLVFGGLCFLPLVCLGLRGYVSQWEYCTARNCTTALIWTPPFICAFALLWMDWGLGIVTGNLVGVPSQEVQALYWTYFVAKRLPMLSGVFDDVFSHLGC
ncbi:hypothetical protein V8E54_012819 [Elaphomyces granulatus]